MDDERQEKNKLIKAAGGLLWRRTSTGLKIAVVNRHRYGNDWTLPKGKLNLGEPWQGAALREVKEETGCEASILSFAGAIAYETEKGPKIVRFWNMTSINEKQQSKLDVSEVAKVDWLSPDEAIQRLSYPLERAMVETWWTKINLAQKH